jgi:hypothetical protein
MSIKMDPSSAFAATLAMRKPAAGVVLYAIQDQRLVDLDHIRLAVVAPRSGSLDAVVQQRPRLDLQHNIQDEIDCAAYENQHAPSEVEHCELPKENIEGRTRCYAFVAVPPSYVQTRGADAADTSDYRVWILAMNAA